MDKLDASVDGAKAKATKTCFDSMVYYHAKAAEAKTEDGRCYNELYGASTEARYAHVLKTSQNQSGAKKELSISKDFLNDVIANCPHEANIRGAARGVLGALSLPSTQSRPDITAPNAGGDTRPFDECSDASNKLDDSVDGTRAKATKECLASMVYYAKKYDAAITEDGRCYNELYAGSSAARYTHVLKSSMNQSGAKKMLSITKDLLNKVITQCTDEPSVLRAAKGILGSL